jgi:nucleoside-diphosphate-sugar epimerase
MTNQISILGCGWLGLPLADFLIKSGFVVKGSTTNLDKISILENNKIQAFQIEILEQEIKGEIASFLEHSEILILNIPPKLRNFSEGNYVKKVETLIPFIEKCKIKKVVFISSTSVYCDENKIITEQTKPNPKTESGKQLLESETVLQSNTNFKTTVIRFGGLIGEGRHPIHFLAGRKNIENPEAPINLIHQKDCIGIIKAVIEQNCFGETFNAVAPYHPTRKDYYSKKAMELGLPLPEFVNSKIAFGKTILSDKVEKLLDYPFLEL